MEGFEEDRQIREDGGALDGIAERTEGYSFLDRVDRETTDGSGADETPVAAETTDPLRPCIEAKCPEARVLCERNKHQGNPYGQQEPHDWALSSVWRHRYRTPLQHP